MLHARPSFALASSPPSQDFAQHRSTIATANGTLAVAKASTDFPHLTLAVSSIPAIVACVGAAICAVAPVHIRT